MGKKTARVRIPAYGAFAGNFGIHRTGSRPRHRMNNISQPASYPITFITPVPQIALAALNSQLSVPRPISPVRRCFCRPGTPKNHPDTPNRVLGAIKPVKQAKNHRKSDHRSYQKVTLWVHLFQRQQCCYGCSPVL